MVVNTIHDLARSYTYVLKGSSHASTFTYINTVYIQKNMSWGIRNRNDARGFRICRLIKT